MVSPRGSLTIRCIVISIFIDMTEELHLILGLTDSKFHGTLIKEHETRVQIYFKTACVTLIKIGHTTFGIKFDWSTCHDNLGIILLLIT